MNPQAAVASPLRAVERPPAMSSDWYADWQHQTHAVHFDGRARLNNANLIRNFEAFNDVRLLNTRIDRGRPVHLVEVGCATGEFYRYLRLRYPAMQYTGLDISEPVIARAQRKYPVGRFYWCDPEVLLRDALRQQGIVEAPQVVYAKDVVHHQVRPLEFLDELLGSATEAVIVRLRTRDVGATEWDPDRSCQYHYEGWMPYIVINLDELISRIRTVRPASEVVVYRHRMVLGGQVNRFLPKDCYRLETGTAETAVGVFLRTTQPGRVTIEDRPDERPRYTVVYRVHHAIGQMLRSQR